MTREGSNVFSFVFEIMGFERFFGSKKKIGVDKKLPRGGV